MSSAERGARAPIRIVLADANVLYPRVLRDYLLYAAAEGVIEIRWSAEILAEVVEHLIANIDAFNEAAGGRLVAAMNHAFPLAQVEPDEDALAIVGGLPLPDPDDAHVLAAALTIASDVLCTNNVKDFPTAVMTAVGITAMTADELLRLLITESGEEMLAVHRTAVLRLPGATDASTLAALRHAGATAAAERMGRLLKESAPPGT